MILLPTHACSGDDGLRPASEPYGELDRDNVATCAVRIRWGEQRWQDVRLPGCGAHIGVCHGCGLRTRVTLPGEVKAPPCPACSATERPEVVHADRQAVGETAGVGSGECGGAGHVATDPASVSPVASRPVERRREVDAGARRPEETKAPSKPRAPQKRVKKGPAATDGPTLPGVK